MTTVEYITITVDGCDVKINPNFQEYDKELEQSMTLSIGNYAPVDGVPVANREWGLYGIEFINYHMHGILDDVFDVALYDHSGDGVYDTLLVNKDYDDESFDYAYYDLDGDNIYTKDYDAFADINLSTQEWLVDLNDSIDTVDDNNRKEMNEFSFFDWWDSIGDFFSSWFDWK